MARDITKLPGDCNKRVAIKVLKKENNESNDADEIESRIFEAIKKK